MSELVRTKLEEQTATLADGTVVVTAFIVTTDTGYRAVLPACPCPRTTCTRVPDHPVAVEIADDVPKWRHRYIKADAKREHQRTHCHSTDPRHREQAEAFARAVEATYSKRRGRK